MRASDQSGSVPSWLRGGVGFFALALVGATCGEAVEFVGEVGYEWLEVSCQNNPKDYCDQAKSLSQTLTTRLREQREQSKQAATLLRGEALGVDLAIIDSGTTTRSIAPIQDGARVARTDLLRLVFRPLQESFVYIFSVNPEGVIAPLFPPAGSTGVNPVSASQTYLVSRPSSTGGGGSGIEHLYLSVTPGPDLDLARARSAFVTRPRSVSGGAAQVRQPSVIGRGAGDAAEPAPPLEASQGRTLPAQRFRAGDSGALVVTRWFQQD